MKKERKVVDLEEFAEKYNNLIKFGFINEKHKRKQLSIMYDVHINSIRALIKRASDANLINTETNNSASDEASVSIDNFFCHAKSTLYDTNGVVKLEWVKTKLDEEKYFKAVEKAILNMMEGFEGKAKPATIPNFVDDDLMTFYPLIDFHLGLLVDKDISDQGIDWDLNIADKSIQASMEHLVNSAPNSKLAVITDMGDYLHTSDDKNRSQSGHVLNASHMHYRVVQVALELAKKLVELALTKHEIVHFYSVKGNHSENIGMYLQAYLSAWFRNEPRVIIGSGNQAHKYFQFGEVLLGFTHYIPSTQTASEVMVFDNQSIFSSTKHRFYHMGHVHHNRLEQGRLVTVECHQNLPARDEWASGMSFRGTLGQSKAITYHKKYGEVSRNLFNLQMIE
jgi:hypothetical protein